MHARFRDHTRKLLEKHGMTLIGFWVPTDPKGAEEVLVYLVAHPSEEAAKKSWSAFMQDEDWKKARQNGKERPAPDQAAGSQVLQGDRLFQDQVTRPGSQGFPILTYSVRSGFRNPDLLCTVRIGILTYSVGQDRNPDRRNSSQMRCYNTNLTRFAPLSGASMRPNLSCCREPYAR